MIKKMSRADKAMLTAVIVIAVFAVGFFATRQGFKPLAMTSGNLDFIKSKCGHPFYNVYQCGSYYCIDTLSGRCIDADINCENAPVVYNCLNLGGGEITCSDSDNGINQLVKGITKLSTDSFGKTDYCSSETNLVEYYCSNNQVQSKSILCQNKCSGGICLNLGGTTECTKSGNNLLINGKIVATDSCSNPTLAVVGTAYKTLYLCKGVSPPSNFVAVSGDLGGYIKYLGSDPLCSTQCHTITEKCPDGSLKLQDSHCNLIPCPEARLCGNGVCDSTETQSSCPQDCIPTVTCYFCQNGVSDSGKWAGSCPSGTSAQQVSCNTLPVCTQEAGQLCNPTTKILRGYSNGCVKQSLLNQGFGYDLTPCQTLPPPVTPPACPLYSPLQCEADEELVPSVNLAGCPTSKCVKVEGLPIWVYTVIIGAIVLIAGGILYFNRKKKKK